MLFQVARLKKHGHIAVVSGPPLITSSRRWEKHGYFKVRHSVYGCALSFTGWL